MNIKEVKEIMGIYFAQEPPHRAEQGVLLLEGGTGVGKSASVKQTAEEMGIHHVDLYLPNSEGMGDFLGMPVVDEEEQITRFRPPETLPQKTEKPGVLCIEEVRSAHPAIAELLKSLLSTGVVGSYELPDNWHIVCTSNPETSEYTSVSSLDLAIEERWVKVNVESDVGCFCDYIEERYNHSRMEYVINLLRSKGTDLFEQVPPRRWEIILNTLRMFEDKVSSAGDADIVKPLLHLSDGSANEVLSSYYQGILPITFDEWQRNPKAIQEAIDNGEWKKLQPILSNMEKDHIQWSSPSMSNVKVMASQILNLPKDMRRRVNPVALMDLANYTDIKDRVAKAIIEATEES